MIEPGHSEADRVSLAEALRTLRRASGLSGERLADRTGISQSKVSKIETGKVVPSIADVERIVHALGVDRSYAAELLALARVATTEYRSHRTAQQRGWHIVQRELAAIEGSAKEIRHLLPMMITGLLQTPEYARQSVSGPIESALTEAMREEIVSHKLERQRVLNDQHRRFTFLLTESALRWRLLDPAAMARQLDRIVTIGRSPTVSIEVVPLAARVPDCPLEVCVIYDNRLVEIETSSGSIALRDPQDIAYHRDQFEFFSSYALSGHNADTFISAIADEFRHETE